MAIRANLPVLVLLLSLLLTLTTLSFARNGEDPGLRPCRQECRQAKGLDQQQEQQCEEDCKDSYREKHGSGSSILREDPQRQHQYQECHRICREQAQSEHQLKDCQKFCEESFGEHRGEAGGEEDNLEWDSNEEQQRSEPYVYQPEHFKAKIRTDQGSLRVLPRFSKRSELLRGIENYRVAVLEANPNSFVLPQHWDAEGLFYVVSGRGVINQVNQNGRHTVSIKRGDILRIQAGTTVYLINNDNSEKLLIAKLFKSISVPGSVKGFHGAAGQNPESFYRALSTEILEAALNSPGDRLERLFGQQKQGAIVRATKEQIKALSKETGGGIWPFGRRDVLNLLEQTPTHANEFGRLYEVTPNDQDQLRDINTIVSLANITAGSMIGPYFNSKATKLSIVTRGSGHLEMACPHISSSSSRGLQDIARKGSQKHEGGARYQKVSAPLRVGTLFVAPAGHPVVAVASNDQNLEIVCFEVNGLDNERIPLAGKKNVVNQMQREALELSFNTRGEEAEQIFRNQDKEFFYPGPGQREGGGRAYA